MSSSIAPLAPAGPVVVAAEVDTTVRIAGAARATAQIRRTAAAIFGEAVAGAGPRPGLDGILFESGRALCRVVGGDRCAILMRDPRVDVYRGRVAYPEVVDAVVRPTLLDLGGDRASREAISSGHAFWSTAAAPSVGASGDPVLVAPLRHRGRSVGLAVLDLSSGRALAPTDASSLTVLAALVARWIGDALEIARATRTREQLDREREYRRRVHDLEARLARDDARSIDDVVRHLAASVERPVALLDDEVVVARSEAGGHRSQALPGPDGRRVLCARAADLGAGEAGSVRLDGADPEDPSYLVVPVDLVDRTAALVIVVDDGTAGEWSRHVAIRGGAACAAASVATRSAAMTEHRARALLFQGLLQDERSDDEVRALAVAVGIDPDQARLVATVSPAGPDALDRMVGLVRPRGAVGFATAEDLVLIVDVPAGGTSRTQAGEVRDRIVAGIAAAGGDDAPVVVSVSATFEDVANLGFALRQARALATLCRDAERSGPGPVGACVDEMGAARLLMTAPGDARRSGAEILGALLDDEPGAQALMSTLATYFECNGSVQGTSVALGIHVNTVRHRFARIAAMTGLNVIATFEDAILAHGAIIALRPTAGVPAEPASD